MTDGPEWGEGEAGDDQLEERGRWDVVRLGLALTLLPLAVAGVHQLLWVGADYHPSGDVALTELHTRNVGRHMLWLGPYSRDGWHHPGPALFYVLALPYRLLGSSGSALSVGALLVNGTSITGMVALARRRGGTEMALATLVVSALLLRALGRELLVLPWNVYVTVLPYGLLVFLVWAMVRGERWALPVATFVTTFLVQTHVGYVVLAVPLLAAGAAWLVATSLWRASEDRPGPPSAAGAEDGSGDDRDRATGPGVDPADANIDDGDDRAADPDADLRALRWPGIWAAAIAVVMWLPPVVQQVRNDPGNLRLIVRWFRHSGEEVRTLVEGWRVVAAQYTVSPEWLAGARPVTFLAEPTYVYQRVVPVLLVVVLAAAVVWWRRGDPAGRALVATWLGASALGVLAAARTVGLLYAYRLRWTWVLGAIGGLLVVWLALQVVRERGGPGRWRIAGWVTLAVLAALGAVNVAAAVRPEGPSHEQSQRLEDLAPALRDEADRAPGRRGEVVIAAPSLGAMEVGHGLKLDLQRHGIPARVVPGATGGDGDSDDDQRVRVAVVVDAEIPPFAEQADHELLAYSGRVPLADLTDDVATLVELREDLDAGTLSEREHQRRSEDLVPAFGAVALFRLDR